MADLLRETFEAYALRAPVADGLRDAVEAKVRRERSRRRWWTAAGAVATAAAVVAGVLVVEGGDPRGERTPVVTEPPSPPGTRWVVWRGIEMAVPAAWFDITFDNCGAPQSDGLMVNDTPREGHCALSPAPHLTLAWSVSVSSLTSERSLARITSATTTDVTIDGVTAQRVSGRNYLRQYAEAIVVPSRDAGFAVMTDDPAVAKRVLDTVRVREGVDSRGCEITPASLFATGSPAREGADRTLVPGSPVQASVCRYAKGSAIISEVLDTERAASLAATLNGLPQGPLTGEDEKGRERPFILRFRYAEGPDVVVYVHVDGPRDVGATNGAASGQPTDALEDALRPIAGWLYTYDDRTQMYVSS